MTAFSCVLLPLFLCQLVLEFHSALIYNRVKLRIKTDCQQFDMKEDNSEVNGTNEADSIDLEPVNSPSSENNSPHVVLRDRDQTAVQSVSILK